MSESIGPQDAKKNSYVVVARRYRPRGFNELVGQDHVGRALKNAIETNRVGHAYLFTGARGVGKTSTARIFAKALNDPSGPTASPDNESDVAQAIDSGEDVDVIEIDGASNRGIDEIRSLRANVSVRPSRSRYKIYIIDEVHMLTGAAFNALLKTLEEPPEHVKFIFCTTDPEKMPITVLSRCQRFDFAPVEVPKIVERLRDIVEKESAEADADALELIARRASGSMRDSQSLLEQVLSFSNGKLTVEQVHAMLGTADDERLHALAKAMAQRDAAEVIRQMDAGIDAGVDAGRLAEQLLAYFRDLMAVTVGCEATLMRHTSVALFDELHALGQRWGLQTVLAVVGLLDQTLVRIRHSVYSRVLLEATAIQICHLPDLQQIVNLAAAADSVTASSPSPARVSPPPTVQEKKNSELNSPHFDRATQPIPEPVLAAAISPSSAPPLSGLQLDSSVAPTLRVDRPVAAEPSAAETSPAPARSQTPSGEADAEADSNGSPSLSGLSWNPQNAAQFWTAAIDLVEPMTETLAHAVDRVVAEGNRLRLFFPGESKLAYSRCEHANHKNALTEAISKLAGREITLELVLDPPKTVAVAPVASASPGRSRMQRMKEIENHPLVKSCLEVFDAEIVKIEKPR
ncbi:DNA polymerase III subunit gamma/tau [Novipirellula artificiosorum]|uniref:DNA polymerase III subunit gamma/tau n=1 Tax=Novipirellula artificiosorum TaxID=2528016 RepID=A0A5C6DKT3_9BACT|nr:DNA polymerase III subunit gamma/tau [Novipirellula artificiosorum]TWU37202.1 DNA polymerase III subunit tau [Novipirellula artificiosorum]